MLYFRALQSGLARLPAADPAIRQRIEERAGATGWPALHAELAAARSGSRGPDPAERPPAHPARARSHRADGPADFGAARGEPARRDAEANISGSCLRRPTVRRWAFAWRSDFDAMMHQGLLDEVRRLRARGDLHAELPAMRLIGYRQLWSAPGERGFPGRSRRESGHRDPPARPAPADVAAGRAGRRMVRCIRSRDLT